AINAPPIASGGVDLLITLPVDSISIAGSGSDPDGMINSYLWTKLSGGAATLIDSSTSTLRLANLTGGTYVFRLTVSDNHNVTAFDDVTVVVNNPPEVN